MSRIKLGHEPDDVKFGGPKYQQVRKYLRRRNERFEKLSVEQQRVAIAKDVISQLNAKKLIAATSTGYLGWDQFGSSIPSRTHNLNHRLNPRLRGREASECTAQLQCTVCGIGSLFVSALEFVDEKRVDKSIDRRHVHVEYLERWFSPEQLDLIEEYFESPPYGSLYREVRGDLDADLRLTMIMENIISNDGVFDPKRGKHS